MSTLLHIATISGVLACLMRHFRASLASLPLLTQPIGNLPIGTWGPDVPLQQLDASFAEVGCQATRLDCHTHAQSKTWHHCSLSTRIRMVCR